MRQIHTSVYLHRENALSVANLNDIPLCNACTRKLYPYFMPVYNSHYSCKIIISFAPLLLPAMTSALYIYTCEYIRYFHIKHHYHRFTISGWISKYTHFVTSKLILSCNIF